MQAGAADERVEAVRRFNRFYTRLLGLLDEGLLHSPFSLAEARVLYELAHRERPTATALAQALGLDAGYLSRILQRFEQNGLLARAAGADRRQNLLALTEAGRKAFAPLDDASRAQIAALLAPLPPTGQAGLAGAMATIERALGAAGSTAGEVRLRAEQPGDIGWVISRHGAVYAEEYGFDSSFEAYVAEVAAEFLRTRDPSRDACWIAERDGMAVGSVFLARGEADSGKLRLLIVEPSARGLGVGRLLVGTCIEAARAAGYRRLGLWTHDILHAARHIYRASGFRLVSAVPNRQFGRDLVSEDWTLDLA